MTKKEKKAFDESLDKVLGVPPKLIPPHKYWEWRTSIEEMLHHKTKLLLSEEQHKTLRALEEVSKMKSQLHSLVISKSKNKLEEIEKDYNQFIEQLEKELGFSIKGKMIDPYTYEVKDE